MVVARFLRQSEALPRPLLILVQILVPGNHGARSDPRPHPTFTTGLNEERPERFPAEPDTEPPGMVSSNGPGRPLDRPGCFNGGRRARCARASLFTSASMLRTAQARAR